MFDYDDTVNLAFDAKIAGKKLVTAKHELLTKTGDFLFLAHSDKELAQRMQMVEEDIEKVAYRKLANVSDSKAKLVRAIYDEWSIRHANCDFCKEAKNVSNDGGGRGKAPAMQSMMTAVPGAKDPGIVKDVTDTAKGVAHAVGTGVGAVARGELGVAKAMGNAAIKAPGQIANGVGALATGPIGTAVGQIGDAARSYGNAENSVIKSVGTGIADVAKGAISGAGSLISQFTQGLKGNSTPAKAPTMPNESNSHDADARIHTDVPGIAGTGSYTPPKPVGPSIGQGPAPTQPTIGMSRADNLSQAYQNGTSAVQVSLHQKENGQQGADPGSAGRDFLKGLGVNPVTTTTSSDSDADGDVDMGRAASKIANLSELLKGSNDTNFIG